MGFVDTIIWGIISLVIGVSVGVAFAKLISIIVKKKDERKLLKIINGKIENNFKLDGETINVNKFITKKNDGEIVRVKMCDIAKNSPEIALNEEKPPIIEENKELKENDELEKNEEKNEVETVKTEVKETKNWRKKNAWTDFIKGKVKPYREKYGSHGEAMKMLGKDYKELKEREGSKK